MLVASWNVNSIKARKDRFLEWLAERKPDVVCLQELKVTAEGFPFEEVRQAGYHAEVFGQKTYNGVAIVSRTKPEDVLRGFDDNAGDPQARCIAATVDQVRIISTYVPNGAEVGSEKYEYKQGWLGRLKRYLSAADPASRPLLVCGDFNIAPEERDVANPQSWEGSVLYNPKMRSEFQELLGLGLVDTFRRHHSEGGLYSWWDYRMLGFPKNDGLRIDHILASAPLADCCVGARIDREFRKGKKPSDHAPVLAEFEV